MKLNHAVVGFVWMAILFSLFATSFNSIQDTYTIQETFNDESGTNVMESLNNLNLLGGVNQTVEGIYSISNPTNPIDVLGSLLSAGIGVIRIATGIVSFPLEILLVITDYYTGWIPPIVSQGFGIIFALYIAFILLSAYTRSS